MGDRPAQALLGEFDRAHRQRPPELQKPRFGENIRLCRSPH